MFKRLIHPHFYNFISFTNNNYEIVHEIILDSNKCIIPYVHYIMGYLSINGHNIRHDDIHLSDNLLLIYQDDTVSLLYKGDNIEDYNMINDFLQNLQKLCSNVPFHPVSSFHRKYFNEVKTIIIPVNGDQIEYIETYNYNKCSIVIQQHSELGKQLEESLYLDENVVKLLTTTNGDEIIINLDVDDIQLALEECKLRTV